MNKRKGSRRISGEVVLKAHLVLYVVCMVMLGLSSLATFTYPGNADISFAVFRPMVINHITVAVLWGMIVLAHVVEQQVRGFLHRRAQRRHLNTIYTSNHKRLVDDYEVEDDDVFYDDAPKVKSAGS